MNRKLSLRKQTIRNLTDAEMGQAGGGFLSLFACDPVPATYRTSGCGETAVTITVCRVNCINS